MKSNTIAFVESVENYAKRRFKFREEIGLLIESAEDNKMQSTSDEITFFAKFITNAESMLNRDKLDTAVTARLANEFRVNLEKSMRMIMTLIENMPPDRKTKFGDWFTNLSGKNLEQILSLIKELTWFKNYSLDHTKNRQKT